MPNNNDNKAMIEILEIHVLPVIGYFFQNRENIGIVHTLNYTTMLIKHI